MIYSNEEAPVTEIQTSVGKVALILTGMLILAVPWWIGVAWMFSWLPE